MPEEKTYRFGGTDYTEKEIDQIVALIAHRATETTSRPVDRRRYSERVLRWAEWYKLIEWRKGKSPQSPRWETVEAAKGQKGARHYYTPSYVSDVYYDAPVEAVYRLIAPIFAQGDVLGYYQITHWPGWERLGLDPIDARYLQEEHGASPGAPARMAEKQSRLLGLLHQEGYVTFLYSGGVWELRKGGPAWATR